VAFLVYAVLGEHPLVYRILGIRVPDKNQTDVANEESRDDHEG
jgi:hypothetical protein